MMGVGGHWCRGLMVARDVARYSDDGGHAHQMRDGRHDVVWIHDGQEPVMGEEVVARLVAMHLDVDLDGLRIVRDGVLGLRGEYKLVNGRSHLVLLPLIGVSMLVVLRAELTALASQPLPLLMYIQSYCPSSEFPSFFRMVSNRPRR